MYLDHKIAAWVQGTLSQLGQLSLVLVLQHAPESPQQFFSAALGCVGLMPT